MHDTIGVFIAIGAACFLSVPSASDRANKLFVALAGLASSGMALALIAGVR